MKAISKGYIGVSLVSTDIGSKNRLNSLNLQIPVNATNQHSLSGFSHAGFQPDTDTPSAVQAQYLSSQIVTKQVKCRPYILT